MNNGIKKHYIYTIKNEFFEDFPDPQLKSKGDNRPNYYVFQGKENKDILWFVPMSTQTEKYERLIQQKEAQGKPTDFAHVCQVGPRKQAFVIQDMFPVTKDYIKEDYIVRNSHYNVSSPEDIKIIQNKAQKVQNLLNRGVKIVPKQADVKSIEKQLIQKLEEKDPKQELQKDQTNQDLEKEQREQKRKAAIRRHLARRER
ncbi:hypothetical protein CEQ21_07215 (plasmid) [Niallia circulans]|uniref:Uncharacterized protein n=1 Tax=Niallia circulans TaxID=1397 RepID=A0A553SQS4_NIACI|nr:hypothetical protein [Niallia circulans]TRZ39343.1 hypothetical protein CEQ21_07215 [Niallia circulans]